MDEMEVRKALFEGLAVMALEFARELDKAQAKAYVTALSDLPVEFVLAAMADLKSTASAFFPTAGQIRYRAIELAAEAAGIPYAEQAWEEVTTQIRQVGHGGYPIFSSELIRDAVRTVGGWHNLCMSEHTASDRARFIEFYGNLRSRRIMANARPGSVKQLIEGSADQSIEAAELVARLADNMGESEHHATIRLLNLKNQEISHGID